MTKITLSRFFIFLFLIFLFPQEAQAAPYGLSISPPLLRVQIKPGKSITQVFTIANLGPDDKTLVARIIPFTQSDEMGNPILNLKSQASWLKYFSLSNSNIKLAEPFILKGGVTEQLVLSISVPEISPLQDLYTSLLVSTYTNTLNPSFQGSIVSATIGSNLLVSICSDLNPSTLLKIENFQITSGSYIKIGNTYLADNISRLQFSAKVRNDGNFTSETKGVFKVSSGKDNPVSLDGILPVYVISKNVRTLLNPQGNPFSYSPTLSQIGSHKVSLEIKTDNSNTSSSIDIIFIPFKVSFGVLISVLILTTIIKINYIGKPNKND